MVMCEETITVRRVLRLVPGRAGAPLPWIPDQVRNDDGWVVRLTGYFRTKPMGLRA